jgi:hypothetical protein
MTAATKVISRTEDFMVDGVFTGLITHYTMVLGLTLWEDLAPTDMATGISTDMVMYLAMEDLISDAKVNLNESLVNEKINVNH